MPATVLRTSLGMSTYVLVVISPATTTSPVVIRVSHATRPCGSSVRTASRTASEIWSAILSGCPSVTDSELKLNERELIAGRLADPEPGSFRGRIALHQRGDEVGERDAVEDGADALGDGHLDAEPVREVAEDGRCRQSLDHHPDLGHGLGGRRAPGDELAATPVPARLRPAGHDQVAHPGEAGERLRPGARGLGEATHLGEATRNERRLGVVPELQAVCATGRKRDHVLRRRAELDAD